MVVEVATTAEAGRSKVMVVEVATSAEAFVSTK
jgi:hypothetical protein